MVSLITGAAGMMGAHLYEYLLDEGKEVIPTFYSPTLDERDSILKKMEGCGHMMDLTDLNQVKYVLHRWKPSVIYHLAAQSRPDVSWNKPELTFEVNLMGTLNLLKACASIENYKPKIINASSSAVYGDIDWMNPPNESSFTKPMSPYGTSKLAQEHLVRHYHQLGHIDYVNVRIFNCTGPRKVNDFISDMCRRVVSQQYPLRVGNLETKRSIVDVRDLVRGLYLAKKLNDDTINLGSSIVYEMKEVFEMIAGDSPYYVDEALIRPADEAIIYGNINKAESLLGWQPKIAIEETIEDTIDYWNSL